jgi:hypothetical protein
MSTPAWVYPNICLGAGASLTPFFVNTNRVTHVINCAYSENSPAWFRRSYPSRYAQLDAHDSIQVKILDWYPAFETAMRTFLRAPNAVVFVHCQAGINRSAFLLLYFMCKNFGLDFPTLLAAVRKQRPQICQNPAFMEEVTDALKVPKAPKAST